MRVLTCVLSCPNGARFCTCLASLTIQRSLSWRVGLRSLVAVRLLSGRCGPLSSTSRLAVASQFSRLTKRCVDNCAVIHDSPTNCHYQAAESLCMNGRALNEKAIEVSPSSSRVLDRAAEILTPFPPSKNRPRPGDWTCPSCGFSNFQRRTACFRCSFPAVSAGPTGEMGYGYGYGPPAMMPPPPHMGHHGHGGGHGRMGGSGVVPFRAGDWKCGNEVCGYHNFAKNVCCLRCGASRAGAAVVADSGYPSPMDTPSSYSMNQGSMTGTPGPGPFASTSGFNSGGGYVQPFGGPPSTYALPSGLGGGAAPYPSLNTHFGPAPGSHSAGPFDSRAAEAAFQSAGNGPASAGPGNNFYGQGDSDPFAFLSTGIGSLSVSNQDARQNGGAAPPNKSPA